MAQRKARKKARAKAGAKSTAKAGRSARATRKKAGKAPRGLGAATERKRRSTTPSADKARAGGGAKGVWSSARDEQHRLKREAILRVASRLINRKGYAGMSLADIADELEIRNASLYYYFESKEDLVFACYERAQLIADHTLQAAETSRGTGLEAIERYVVSARERMRKEGELPLADSVDSLTPAHMKAIIASHLDHVRRVGRLIERGIQDGSIRACNVPLTTRMFFAAQRAVHGHYVGVAQDSWPDLDEEVLVATRRFLAARPD